MTLVIHRNELKLVAIIGICAFSVVAWSWVDTSDMMAELHEIATQKLNDYLGEEDPAAYETLILVDGGKSFNLFGRAWGVIHVYIRNHGDEEMKTFKGIEYYFKRYNGKWLELDSAADAVHSNIMCAPLRNSKRAA